MEVDVYKEKFLEGVYIVRDNCADNYLNPFTAINNDVAIRMFANSFQDNRSAMASNPGDFDLYRIGHYDRLVGEIIPENKVIIARGTDYAVV